LVSKPLVSECRRLLTCHGWLVDEIDHMTPPQWPLEAISRQETDDTRTRVEHYPFPSTQRVLLQESLWNVLVGGSAGFPHDRRAPPEYSQLLDLPWPSGYDELDPEAISVDLIGKDWCSIDEKQDLITFVTFRQRAGRGFDLCGHPLGSFFGSDQAALPSETPIETQQSKSYIWSDRRMLRQACNTLKRRRLFVTREGRLGVCTRQARPGDEVAVLKGCSTALILRRWTTETGRGFEPPIGDVSREVYIVVGAAYLDGVMQGECERSHSWRERALTLV
jgi:hypothetical protein